MLLNFVTPLVPSHMVLVIYCLSKFVLSFTDLAADCTRVAITLHQSKMNNAGDVGLKDKTQAEAINFLIQGLSIPILLLVEGKMLYVKHKIRIIILYNLLLIQIFLNRAAVTLLIICVSAHIFCNYKVVTSLEMVSLNKARILISLKSYLQSGRVPSVTELNKAEPILLRTSGKQKNVI